MRLRHKLLVLAPALALATTGLSAALPGAALAGTGPSQFCQDGNGDGEVIPILNGVPLTLGLETPALVNHSIPTYVQVCYATTPFGSTATPSVGGDFVVNVGLPGTTNEGTFCGSDSTSLVTVDCQAQTDPTAAFAPAPNGGDGGTLTVAVPVTLCLGSNLTGTVGCGTGPTAQPSVGSTGVVVATFGVAPQPSGYSTGSGVTLTGVQILVDGIPIPFSGTTAQVGVNPNLVNTGTATSGVPFCAPLVGCGFVPIGAAVSTQTASVAGVQIGGTFIPLPGLPYECLSFGRTC